MPKKWTQRLAFFAGVLTALCLVVYFALVATAEPVPDHPAFDKSRLLVIAHQGGDGLRPSNTMSAFQNAVDLGVDVLEMDIHSTADGVLVVIHDDTVDRTTDGTGRVNDLTFEELQALDAGYHWPTLDDESSEEIRAAGTFPYRGQGITIPALAEVFEAFPDMPMVIEIKQKEPSIVAEFCAMLREYGMTDQVVVPSFHPEVLQAFRAECPEVPTASAEDEVTVFFVLNTLGLFRAYHPVSYAFHVPEYSGSIHVLTENFVRGAQHHNIDVAAWTINEPEQIQRMIDLGVNGIMTDYPDRVFEALGR